MHKIPPALVILLAGALLRANAAVELPPILTVEDTECPAATHHQGESLGDTAIIADDGSSLVLQCGDGTVRAWHEDQPKLKRLAGMTLFEAAQAEGILPGWLRCPWPEGIAEGSTRKPDCEVVDRNADGSTYILRIAEIFTSFIASKASARELSLDQASGVLLPRSGQTTDVLIVTGQVRPQELQKLSLRGRKELTPLVRLPQLNLIFEHGEGQADEVRYSSAYNLLVVPFSGAFRVAEEMTYVRAFALDGKEKWSIRGQLPKRDEDLIVGDATKLVVFDGGRRAVLGRTSSRFSSDVLDLKAGRIVGKLPGWPIAAAANAARVMVKKQTGELVLIRP